MHPDSCSERLPLLGARFEQFGEKTLLVVLIFLARAVSGNGHPADRVGFVVVLVVGMSMSPAGPIRQAVAAAAGFRSRIRIALPKGSRRPMSIP